MGRQEFSCIGHGMTESEAQRNAIDEDRNYNGHQEGYSGSIGSACYDEGFHSKCITKPKPAKTCEVDRNQNKGTRKWETVYVLEGSGDIIPQTAKTQGEAIKMAKASALLTNKTIYITIEKRLVGNSHIATVRPKASTMGKWRFWGWART